MKSPVEPGSVLAGKYRIDAVLGEGGMGVVVAATHLHLDQRVALKFIHPEFARDANVVQRFSREARASVKIQSEHVARVLDVGTLENGLPYMVMEYLEGCDLSELLRRRGALPGQEAIEYVLQACEALAEAHVAGIVHRDLKPANLFLTRRADGSPFVKVLDFGISKALLGDTAVTQASAVLGSPRYMSPEQLRSSRDVDPRSDIWAIGIVLHELLTGEGPFRANTVPELYVTILEAPPEPLRARRPDAPPGVEAIILRCLEKDPARRYANVAELAKALAEFAPPHARLSIERALRIAGAKRVSPTMPEPTPGGISSPGPPLGYASSPQGYSAPYAQPLAPLAMMPDGRMGPSYTGPMAPPPRPGVHPALIVVLTLAAVMALGLGGCMMCVCAGAAAASPAGAADPAR